MAGYGIILVIKEGGKIMNSHDWDTICKKLDKFMEDNLEIVSSGYNAFPSGMEKKLDDFIDKTREIPMAKKSEFFQDVLERMRNELGLEKSEVYTPAKVSKSNYSKWLGHNRPHVKKEEVIAIGFALIGADVHKNKPPKLLPEDRMYELLISAGGIDYTLKNSVYDLVIIFSLKEEIFDIDDINHLLRYKHLLELPKWNPKGN